MRFDRAEMKRRAKEHISGIRPYFIAPGSMFVFLNYLISQIFYRLSGYTEYMSNYMTMIMNYYYYNEELYELAWPTITPVAWVLMIAIMVMMLMLDMGFVWYCIRLSRKIESKIRNMFDVFGYFTKSAILVVVKTIILAVGMLFLFIPYFIFKYMFIFAEHIMYDNPDYSVFKCLSESAKLTNGRKGELFILDLSFIGWFLLRSNVFVTGIWVTPYHYTTIAEYYNRLIRWVAPLEKSEEPTTEI